MRRSSSTRTGRAYRLGRRLASAAARRWRLLAGVALGAVLVYLVFWVVIPSRCLTIAPGPAPDVATLVTPLPGAVGAGADPAAASEATPATGPGAANRGRFLLTTVQASPATPAELWKALTREDVELYPRSYLVPEGMSDEIYGQWSLAAMTGSQFAAAWQAFSYLGRPAGLAADGGKVFWVAGDSPAKDRLREGDLVVSWTLGDRGGTFIAAEQFERDISGAYGAFSGAAGAVDLVLGVRRDAVPFAVAVPIEPSDLARWPFLGLALGAERPRTAPAVPVDFSPGDIGGPSGGLMLALQIVDDFTPGDLTGGQVVAGTGTVGPGGEVGPVGGIGLKLRGAVAAGAAVFLVPEQDYEEARSTAKALGLDVDLVQVFSLAEACQALSQRAGALERPRPALVARAEPRMVTLSWAAEASLTVQKTPDYNRASLGGLGAQVAEQPLRRR